MYKSVSSRRAAMPRTHWRSSHFLSHGTRRVAPALVEGCVKVVLEGACLVLCRLDPGRHGLVLGVGERAHNEIILLVYLAHYV